MGVCTSQTYKLPENMYPLKITSFCVDMSNTFDKVKNINKIANYFFSENNGKNIDVLCLQRINTIDIYKTIIKTFKKKVNSLNKKNNKETTLHYYPYDYDQNISDDKTSDSNNDYETWSLSDRTTADKSSYGKLIISRYESVLYVEDNMYTTYGSDNKNTNISKKFDKNTKTNESNFLGMFLKNKKNTKNQAVNIKIKNIIVSIYNIDIAEQLSNIEFSKNIEKITSFISTNNAQVKMYCRSHPTIQSRSIHVLCGNFGIKEVKNNIMNKIYIRLVNLLNGIDAFRYVLGIRGVKNNNLDKKHNTNIMFTRNNFIFITSKIKDRLDNLKNISEKMYLDYGLVTIDAYIDDNLDEFFINYPTNVLVMIDPNWVIAQDDESSDEGVPTYREIESNGSDNDAIEYMDQDKYMESQSDKEDMIRNLILNDMSCSESDDVISDDSNYDKCDDKSVGK